MKSSSASSQPRKPIPQSRPSPHRAAEEEKVARAGPPAKPAKLASHAGKK
jgi:hypothetical protein